MHSYWDDFWSLRGRRRAGHRAGWAATPPTRCASPRRATSSAPTSAHRSVPPSRSTIDYLPGRPNSGTSTRPRARSRWRWAMPVVAAAGTGAQHVRALLERIMQRRGRPARVEGLHALRIAHHRQLRAPGLARTRERDARFLPSPGSSRRAGGRGRVVSPRRASRSSSATCRMPGWNRLHPLVADMLAYESATAARLWCSLPAFPADWLDVGIAVDGLRTPYGETRYAMEARGRCAGVEARCGA